MSGRIALMVRGLPSIGIDEAVERFGKYYPEIKSGVFHTSPSFTGMNTNNSISFVNAKTNSYSGGQGLTEESMRDLRKLREDFESYTQANPSVYSNTPTSDSRARLYRRVGFQQDPSSNFQAIDTRRIASEDLPYVQAIDASIMTPSIRRILRPNVMESFVKNGDNVLAGSRLGGGGTLENIMKGGNEKYMIDDIFSRSLSAKRFGGLSPKGKTRSEYLSLINPTSREAYLEASSRWNAANLY